MVEADLERGEPLQGELDNEDRGSQGKATKYKVRVGNPLDSNLHKPPAKKIRLGQFSQAGAVSKEIVLMKDNSCVLSEKSDGGKGHPELCGWLGGGELASVAFLYSTYELKGCGSKHETHSCRPLTGKARVTSSSKIEEGLRQSTPRSKEIKEAAPAEPAGIKAEESTADGIAETVLQEDITTDDIDGLVLRDSADQECLRPVKLLVEQLGDTAALEDVTADNVMTRTLTNYDESQ